MPITDLLAITVALPHEAKAILPKMAISSKTQFGIGQFFEGKLGPHSCLLVQTGMGPQNAQKAAGFLIENYPVTHLLATGYCGALVPEIKNRDAILASELLSRTDSRQRIACDMSWGDRVAAKLTGLNIPVHRGVMVESPEPILKHEDKVTLAHETGALAVDMESFSVLNTVQRKEKITSLCLRFVVDALDDNLTNTEAFIEDTGGVKPLRLLGEAIRRPKLLIELPGLERLASGARKNLEKSIESVVSLF